MPCTPLCFPEPITISWPVSLVCSASSHPKLSEVKVFTLVWVGYLLFAP